MVKKHQPASFFPYLCRISDDMLECQKISAALDIFDEPNSCHYANVLKKLHSNFAMPANKLSDNPKYSELANEAMDCLIESLHSEEATQPVPEAFNTEELYLLDKQLEFCPVDQLVCDDVPWFSRRLQNVQTYRYMKDPPRDRHGGITLPQSLGVKLLSSLVVEELDDGVLSLDNECQEEQFAHDRGQNHGCLFVLTLDEILLSAEFKLGVLRIVHHQKNTELTETEISLADKLSNLQFSCYYEINTILKRTNDGSVIQGSSDKVFCALIEHINQDPLLCIAPHCDDKDGVVKEIAQNLNRYLGGIIQNESFLEAMIKSSSPLNIQPALDKCKVKPYIPATKATEKHAFMGQEIKSTIVDLLIVLNYTVGEKVKYWSDDGKLVLAKIIAVNQKIATNIAVESITLCSKEGDDSGKIMTSPILVSKYLHPSFIANWRSEDKIGCSDLLLYHMEDNPVVSPLVTLEEIKSSLQNLSYCQFKVILKRLFFHSHFYFVKCSNSPDIFNHIILQYFVAWITFFASVDEGNCNELTELMEQMGIPIDSEADGDVTSDVSEITRILRSNTEFPKVDFNDDDDDDVSISLQTGNPHTNSQTIGTSTLQSPQSYTTTPQTAHLQTVQPSHSGLPTTNVFTQPVAYSIPTSSGFFRTLNGGYRNHVPPQRPVPVSVWNQNTSSTSATATNVLPPPPQTNIDNALVWLKQAIADFNAATHHIECTSIVNQQMNGAEISINISDGNSCQFPALVCFLSHEVVEKCLKATYLATCGSTLTDQRDFSLVRLYDYLSSSRCWPLADIKDFVHQVSDHNKRCRYPNSHVPPEAPCVVYTELDARHALAAAQEIFVKVCSIESFKDKLPSQPCMMSILPSTIYLDPDGKLYICTSTDHTMQDLPCFVYVAFQFQVVVKS